MLLVFAASTAVVGNADCGIARHLTLRIMAAPHKQGNHSVGLSTPRFLRMVRTGLIFVVTEGLCSALKRKDSRQGATASGIWLATQNY